MAGKESEKNPIRFHIDGEPVRDVNYVYIRYNAEEYKRLLLASKKTKLSISKIIAISSQPCAICGNDAIDFQTTIPLGLISAKRQSSGKRKKNANKT